MWWLIAVERMAGTGPAATETAVAGVAVRPAELVEAQYPQPSEACSQRGRR